jgi:signal transduction histidine kinase/CheY-like chemotaxis protein
VPSSELLLIEAANAMDLKWVYVDAGMTCRQVSAQYCQWQNTIEQDVLGCSVHDVVSAVTIERLAPYWDKALSGDVVSFTGRIRRTGLSYDSYVKATYVPHFKEEDVIGFYAFYEDLTEETNAIETLRKLHTITAGIHLPLEEKIKGILNLGIEVFSLPMGLVSHITEQRYEVKYAVVPEDAVKPGDEFDLGITYCCHTVQANGPVAFHHAGESKICMHPCYENFGLESYIGIPIFVNEERFGTLNFSSPEIHDRPFSEHDFELIRLFAQWIGNELERSDAQRALNLQKNLLEVMSKQARIGIWELTVATGELYWSDMTKEIHEVTEEFSPQLDSAIHFYKEGASQQGIIDAVDLAMKTAVPWDLDVELVTAKGNLIWVNAMGQAEIIDGECVRLFGSFQDIDDRVKSRIKLEQTTIQAEAAAKSKSDFLANMSHEIRTPMNGVLGMLGSVLNTPLSDEQKFHLGLAQRSAESLLSLINDILDFSKVDAGKLELESIEFDLLAMLDEFSESMAVPISEKRLEFRRDFSKINLKNVKGDPNRLRQILTNLIGNAIKFTQQGFILIDVALLDQDNHIECVIKVQDSGVGIPEEKVTTLFDAFTQADTSTTRKFGGTGLGLAIVRQLCQLMDGDLSVTSENGKGSCFVVKVRLEHPDTPHTVETIESMSALQSINTVVSPLNTVRSFSGNKILLVEDNFINQEVAKEQLKQLSLNVDVAENGLEAIELLKAQRSIPYELILMDCQMPEMDGYQATKAIRAGEAGAYYQLIPVVALTANAMKGDREKCIASGMDDYLSKPMNLDELYTVLKAYLPDQA